MEGLPREKHPEECGCEGWLADEPKEKPPEEGGCEGWLADELLLNPGEVRLNIALDYVWRSERKNKFPTITTLRFF